MVQVSVIIPVYNCELFVYKAIESVLAQTFKDYEIIVVDDGSLDRSLYEAGKYSDRAKIIHKNNGGTASALNTGIKESKGEFIKWLSADDELYPHALESLMHSAKTIPPSEERIYYTEYHVIDASGKIQYQYPEPNRNEWTLDQRLQFFKNGGYYCNMSTSLIHKSIFDRLGLFDESLPYFEDLEFMIRAIKNNIKPTLTGGCVLKYRMHPGQISNRVNTQWREVIWRKHYG